MIDAAERWSLPWHALQRTLAAGFAAATTGAGSATPGGVFPREPAAAPSSDSWMRAAHSQLRQQPGRAAK